MAGPNVTIGGTPLNPPVSSFEAAPPKANRVQVLNGGYESAPRSKGWRFLLTFGSGVFAHSGTRAALRDALGSLGSTTTLTYTDDEGSDHTHTVLVDESIGVLIGTAGLSKSFTIELVEAP